MKMKYWCKQAIEDQNEHLNSHIYANYRHTLTSGLISSDGRNSLTISLENLTPRLLGTGGMVEGGLAGHYIDLAQHLHYRDNLKEDLGIDVDFRLASPNNFGKKGQIFANLRMEPVKPRPSATVGQLTPNSNGAANANSGKALISAEMAPRPQVNAPAIRWLTARDVLLKELSKAHEIETSLDPLKFFRTLVALLGLKSRTRPPETETVYTLNLFRLLEDSVLHRPHAASTGYPDRHCGDTPFHDFGATVDNRNGQAALPEAIAFATDIEQVVPPDAEYQRFSKDIAPYASWISGLGDGAITATLKTAEVHAGEMAYVDMQPKIIERLGGYSELCDAVAAGLCSGCKGEESMGDAA
ncbi:hypothetical protein VH569_05380 [Azospirillum sp. 11R-A]|uniref:hypothetical protein n=1 Tax=Azospirillum sp. 11R-A TaxID=3111634 RepID=UPI003C18ADF6